MENREIAAMYGRVVRKPNEGTASAAIKVHAQACGMIAYMLDVHPDAVARAVADVHARAVREAGFQEAIRRVRQRTGARSPEWAFSR